MEAKCHHAGFCSLCEGHNLAEIQIKCQNHSVFGNRFGKDFQIWQALQPLFPKMDCLMPSFFAEPAHYAHINPHIS